jgi:lipoic acid synthetase
MDDSHRATPAARRRLPPWLKKKLVCGAADGVRDLLADLRLETVCRSAHCPNAGECYGKGRATFLLMGPNCTRRCTFCAVEKEPPAPLDPDEPGRVAEACRRLELRHAVVTSVTRDDLPDGGANHFAETVRAVRGAQGCSVEVLTPDFRGDADAIEAVAAAEPEIFNHNIETVPRLYPRVRPEADFEQSLALLALLGDRRPEQITKSGLMLGLGETRGEIREALRALREAGCRIVTIGQYLAPSQRHHPVVEYVEPAVFEEIGAEALAMGFDSAPAGPFVRSSYNAEEVFAALRGDGDG